MKKIILVLLLLHQSLSSLVVDRFSQDGIHVSDYCPDLPYCTEGSHVMCMYYNPNRTMGPRCENPQNVSMTPLLANKLLDFTNAIRGKIAMGKEKGLNGVPLPKAYGMMRVKWDSELATIAQVFANQCLMTHDLCRATKRFHDPGQTMGLCRFLYPTWNELTHGIHKEETSTPGLNVKKLMHAMNQVVKSWYTRKNSVHTDMLMDYPDWTQTPTVPKLYMELIYSPITHMGCGLSAYTAYDYHSRTDVNFNVVQVVCNFSNRPHKGSQVYTVEAPSEVGYTIKCGCPPGYDEDNDCLCYESPRQAIGTDAAKLALPELNRGQCTNDLDCKPSVVLLPIFTVENAPPEKLITRKMSEYRSRFENNVPELDIFDTSHNFNNESVHSMQNMRLPSRIQSVLKIIQESQPSQRAQQAQQSYPSRPTKQTSTTTSPRARIEKVRSRFFDKKTTPPKTSYRPRIGQVLAYAAAKKQSIFSNVPTFDLNRKAYNIFKQDVKPRRDFADIKNLVKNYLNIRKNRVENADSFVTSPSTTKRGKTKTTTVLSSAEEKVMNYNYYTKKTNSNSTKASKENVLKVLKAKSNVFSDFDLEKPSNEKSDDTLMHLLDKLEREVRHIELDGSRKEMFDEKIRRIYDSVVGKPVDLLKHAQLDKLYETEFSDYETTDLDRYENEQRRNIDFDNGERSAKALHHKAEEFSVKDNRINANSQDKYFNIERKERPITRNRNDLVISSSDKSDKNQIRSLKKTNYDLEIERRYGYDRKKGLQKGVYSEDDEINPRHTYNEKAGKQRGIFSDVDEKRSRNDVTEKRRILQNDRYDDLLGADRRKYYQAKLVNLERTLRTRFKDQKENNDRQVRLIRPATRDEEPLRPGKKNGDPFYMPDRARFLQGF